MIISQNVLDDRYFKKRECVFSYYSPITAYPGTPEYLYVENSCQYLFEKSFRNF